jgi:hypothetical protein
MKRPSPRQCTCGPSDPSSCVTFSLKSAHTHIHLLRTLAAASQDLGLYSDGLMQYIFPFIPGFFLPVPNSFQPLRSPFRLGLHSYAAFSSRRPVVSSHPIIVLPPYFLPIFAKCSLMNNNSLVLQLDYILFSKTFHFISISP